MTNEGLDKILDILLFDICDSGLLNKDSLNYNYIYLDDLKEIFQEVKSKYIITPNDIKSKSEIFGYHN